jgi:hypothetical protein
LGHESQFPAPQPSGRYLFGQETFSERPGIERDAPIPDARRSGVLLRSSTDSAVSGPSAYPYPSKKSAAFQRGARSTADCERLPDNATRDLPLLKSLKIATVGPTPLAVNVG